jgi:TRAP-type C4-dicarboxylate transport system permease small subunit
MFISQLVATYQRVMAAIIGMEFRVSLFEETGEGVISTAIVVLIIAFLAVGMWVAFKVIMGNATTSISTQISQIGQ